MRSFNIAAMFSRRAFRCARTVSKASPSNLLRNAGNLEKSTLRSASSLSAALQSRLLRGTLAKNSSILAAQEKSGKGFAKNLCVVAAACNTLNSPHALVALLIEAGIGTDLQEDDDEMSSVTGKDKHRRKQSY